MSRRGAKLTACWRGEGAFPGLATNRRRGRRQVHAHSSPTTTALPEISFPFLSSMMRCLALLASVQ